MFKKNLAMSAGILAAVTPMLLFPVQANAAQSAVKPSTGITVIAQGETETGGWVEFTGIGSSSSSSNGVQPMKITSVGGGTWSYGSTLNAGGQKVCYSQYMHPSVWHGSSVDMGGRTQSATAGPGLVADSGVAAWTGAACLAYWSK